MLLTKIASTAPPIASILIPSHENPELLSDCLKSLARSVSADVTPYEVIVLFQQTSHESAAAFLAKFPGVRGMRTHLNLGFAAGNNFAARHARGRYLVFLNDDATTQDGWLEHLLRNAERDTSIGAVGSRIIFPDGRLQEAGAIVWSDGSCHPLGRGDATASLSYSYVRDVDYTSANGLLVPLDLFKSVGGFDERYFPGYYEDVDLCLSIRHKLGKRVVYEPRSVIVHRESSTAGRDPDFKSFLFRRHQQKLRDKWHDVLGSYPSPQPESPIAIENAVMRARGNPKRVLVIDDRVPRASMGSGFGRTADMLSDLASAGLAVSFAPSDSNQAPLANPFVEQGINLILEPLVQYLQGGDTRYDAVIISRPHNFRAFYTTVRRAMPNAAIIYDVEALYHRRLTLQANIETDPMLRARTEAEADAMHALEVEITRSADLLVAISDTEVEWLNSIDGHAPVHFLRPVSKAVELQPATLSERSGAVFIAGWLAGQNSPNVGALRWYADEVLPRVRAARPDFVTLVTGGNPPLSVQRMATEGLRLLGFVESIAPLYQSARVALAPVLVGAGVKIKTIEALQYGVPVVATTCGAEGLGLRDGEEIDIADDSARYAERIITLMTDDDYWLSRRQKIAGLVTAWRSEQCSWREVLDSLLRNHHISHGADLL